jgi:hypothetical protein
LPEEKVPADAHARFAVPCPVPVGFRSVEPDGSVHLTPAREARYQKTPGTAIFATPNHAQ